MEFATKYDLKSLVWIMSENEPLQICIAEIRIKYEDRDAGERIQRQPFPPSISYKGWDISIGSSTVKYLRDEDSLFDSKRELLESFL